MFYKFIMFQYRIIILYEKMSNVIKLLNIEANVTIDNRVTGIAPCLNSRAIKFKVASLNNLTLFQKCWLLSVCHAHGAKNIFFQEYPC